MPAFNIPTTHKSLVVTFGKGNRADWYLLATIGRDGYTIASEIIGQLPND